MNPLLEADGSRGAASGSPVPAALGPSVSAGTARVPAGSVSSGTPRPCRAVQRLVPALGGLAGSPRCAAQQRVHGRRGTLRPTPALPQRRVPAQLCQPPASPVHLGHPCCLQTLTHPCGFRLAPEQPPKPPSSGTSPPAQRRLRGWTWPKAAPRLPTSCHKHPRRSRLPHVPWGCTSPEPASAVALQAWEESGSKKHPGLIKPHQPSPGAPSRLVGLRKPSCRR